MALMKKLNGFWALGLCLVASKLGKALLDIPKLPTIYDPQFIKECVDSHNEFRSKVNPSAADMNILNWDKELAKLAKSWSKQCKFLHNPCTKKRYACIEGHDFVGESIYLGGVQSTPKQIISSWYNESEHYNFENMTCSKTCGHYTQIVWANTLTVGCAVSNCPNLMGYSAALFVCNYAPPGNEINTSPYTKGEPCSMCKRGDCRNNLCENLTERAMQPRACYLLMLGSILHRIL